MQAKDYSRPADGVKLDFAGMVTILPPDRVPPGKVPFAQNVRAYHPGVGPRLGQQDPPLLTQGNPALIHSLRRMNDSTPAGPVSGYVLVSGSGLNLFAGAMQVATGFSGKRMSLAIFRPDQSVQPWTYVGDSAKAVKVRSDGLTYNTGIAEPQVPAVAIVPIRCHQFDVLARFEFTGLWQPFGAYLPPITLGNSTGGLILPAILTDYNSPQGGEFNIVSTTDPAVAGITVNQIFQNFPFDSLVEYLAPQPTNTTIATITYDSGTTGPCTIVTTSSAGPVTPDSIYQIGTEYAVVKSVLSGPGSATILRFNLTGTHIVGEAMVGFFNIKVACVTPTTPSIAGGVFYLHQGSLAGTISLPAGIQTFRAASGNMSSGRKIEPSDVFHFQFRPSVPGVITSVTIRFDYDPTAQDFVTNGAIWTIGGPFIAGWNEFTLPVNDPSLIPFGQNPDLGPATGITGIRIEFITTGGTDIDYRELAIIGNYGPAVTPQELADRYRYVGRSSLTGAKSNPSPEMRVGVVSTNAVGGIIPGAAIVVQIPPLAYDPQIDTVDIYRDGGGTLDTTYVGSIPNDLTKPVLYYLDTTDDATIAANPLLEFDNFEPFPSIDLPASGMVTVSGFIVTWFSGTKFNTRWAPGTVITINGVTYQLYNRPQSVTSLTLLENAGTQPNVPYFITAPTLLAQRLPALWGPTDEAGYFFGVGDSLRPGTLYFTKGNNPDSAPDTNQIELTSPSEPLMNGVLVNGLSLAMSTERGWLNYPNFSQAVATITGVTGSPFTSVESITERGLFARQGICVDGGGNVYFVAKDGIRISPGGAGSQSITDEIYNLFPHEGFTPVPVTVGDQVIQPPDFTQPDGMALRFSQGYVYFDFIAIDTNRYTLVYEVATGGWCLDIYRFTASIHADNEGPGIGVLTGCADGSVRDLNSTAQEPGFFGVVATPAFDGGDNRATKHWGDIWSEVEIGTNVLNALWTLNLWLDNYTVQQLPPVNPGNIPVPPVTSPFTRQGWVSDINSGAGVFARNVGVIYRCPINSGGILYTFQPTLIPQPETINQRFTDWDDGGVPDAKFVQGLVIEVDTGGVNKVIGVKSGDSNLIVQTFTINTVGQRIVALALTAPFISHNMRIEPQDTVPWRMFSPIKWVFVPIPELVPEWHTEGTSHGLLGWQHEKEINIAHISTADLILTLVPDNGPAMVITVPNSGGKQTKTLVTLPANKWKIIAYNINSAQPFRLWVKDIEVKVKQWGSDGPYQIIRPFGGQSELAAEI